jgi:hypothetical protein
MGTRSLQTPENILHTFDKFIELTKSYLFFESYFGSLAKPHRRNMTKAYSTLWCTSNNFFSLPSFSRKLAVISNAAVSTPLCATQSMQAVVLKRGYLDR